MKNLTNIVFLLFPIIAFCQDTLTIEEVLKKVIDDSDKARNIEDEFSYKNLDYENYKKLFLPQVSLNASMPYQRSIQEVLQSNGSTSLIERNYTSPTINLSTKQILPFTGGEINLTNSVSMNDDLTNKIRSFSSNWVNISYSQTINGFNQYKWMKKKYVNTRKIDTINYKKFKATLKKETAKIYLDTYVLQLKCKLTKENIIKTNLLLNQFEEKKTKGRVTDLEIKQIQILISQLQQKLENDTFEQNVLMRQLKNQLNLDLDTELTLMPIKEFELMVNKDSVIKSFLEANYNYEADLKLIMANEKIDRAKKEGAINAYFQLGIGLNSSSSEIKELYDVPAQRQTISFGFNIPLLNWDILKNKKNMAELEKSILVRELKYEEFLAIEEAENLYNYISNNAINVKIAKKEIELQKETNDLLQTYLLLGRSTIYDYKNQLFEYEKSLINYNELLNNKLLLKLSLEEFFFN